MKRGGYLKRSAMKRSSWLKRDPFGLKKRSLKRAGKKAKLREQINSRLRRRFKALGLFNVCEMRLKGCWNRDHTWAHGKKDRFLTMHEREFLVVRACTYCHRIADEELGHEGMLKLVETIIANRNQELVAA